MGGVCGFVLHDQINQPRYLFVVMRARTTRPKFIVQPGQPPLLIATAPMTDYGSTDTAAPRHLPIGSALARQQYDLRAAHQRVREAVRAHQGTQLFAVRVANHQGRIWSAHPPHLAPDTSRPRAICKVINGTNRRFRARACPAAREVFPSVEAHLSIC